VQKPATTEHAVHALIQDRWSPRAFSAKPIPSQLLRSLFEAARWAPSSSNEQPWAFLAATKDDQDTYAKLLSTLVPFNQTWAQSAPVLAVAISELAFAKSGQPNRNAFYDTGAAVSQLTTEATSRGVFVHQMGGFEPDKVVELFNVPNGWQPIAAIAIGFPGDPETLPEQLKQRELAARERKPLAEIVMGAKWGEPASFLRK